MPAIPEQPTRDLINRRGSLENFGGGGVQRGTRPSFMFIGMHGAFGSETQYRDTDAWFRKLGHRFMAIRSPIDRPGISYAELAEHAAEEIEPFEHLRPRLIANSRMCNVAPLVASLVELGSLELVCGTIAGTKEDLVSGKLRRLPQKHGDLFVQGVEYINADQILTRLNPSVADRTLCQGLKPYQRELVMSGLRVQTQREEDTVLFERPGIPERAYYGEYDPVVLPAYIQAASLELLGKPAIKLPTGHLPHVSHPELFARRMIQSADEDFWHENQAVSIQ